MTEYYDSDLANDDIEIIPAEAADILCLSASTLKKWRSTDEQPDLPWIKRFNRIYYLKSDVIRFKKIRTVKRVSKEYI